MIDDIIRVDTATARSAARDLCAPRACSLASRPAQPPGLPGRWLGASGPNSRTLTIFPDTGERYLSIEGLW